MFCHFSKDFFIASRTEVLVCALDILLVMIAFYSIQIDCFAEMAGEVLTKKGKPFAGTLLHSSVLVPEQP